MQVLAQLNLRMIRALEVAENHKAEMSKPCRHATFAAGRQSKDVLPDQRLKITQALDVSYASSRQALWTSQFTLPSGPGHHRVDAESGDTLLRPPFGQPR